MSKLLRPNPPLKQARLLVAMLVDWSIVWLRHATLALVLATFIVLGGCGHIRGKIAGSLIADVAAATVKHDDVELVLQATPVFLLLLEGMIEDNPDNASLLVEAARGYVSYGTILEAEEPERTGRIYARAKEYGKRALHQNKKIAPLIDAPYREFSAIAEHLVRDDIESVFWAASSWGAWIFSNTESMAALADLPRVILLMQWVVDQDESLYNASPHIFLGVFHSALPPMLGGKPEQALFHFERALELTQEHSAVVYVQMARFYAVQQFDRELYQSLLHKALGIPSDAHPMLTLQNEAAHLQAQRLLLMIDDIF